VPVNDKQVRKLMEEMSKHGNVGKASMKAGMDRKTGRKYLRAGKLPSDMKKPRNWRTRSDPFEADWPDIEAKLVEAPELEATTIMEWLNEKRPGRYAPGQLRTLQRRFNDWRALHGPEKEVFFAQKHRAGEAMQTDFTWGDALEITIRSEPFKHMLCHPVLPYSNWEWTTVCRSESLAALRRGVQEAVFQLGCVPEYHQTDNSTAATHNLKAGKRGFNEEYVALMNHLGMKPRTTGIGKKEQNGDVEALNGALKRRLNQHLLLRHSRDFECVDEYEKWIQSVLKKANHLRLKRLKEELAVMRPLVVERLPEYKEEDVRVTTWGTIRVKHNAYSVPSRLKGQTVRVRIYDDRLEIFFRGTLQYTVERLLGKNGHHVNYRHVIWSLVRKPGAFPRYKYREDLFPTFTFRKAYDSLSDNHANVRDADMHYLRILHLAASTMEEDVERALDLVLQQGLTPRYETVKGLVLPEKKTEVPEQSIPAVDLSEYDALLASKALEVVK